MNGLLYIGNNGLSAESKNPDYLSGYQQGVAQRNSGTASHTLPIQTDDNYKNFFIGYHDGAIQMDHDWNVHPPALHYGICPSGHTQEYCGGYKAGYHDEGWALDQ